MNLDLSQQIELLESTKQNIVHMLDRLYSLRTMLGESQQVDVLLGAHRANLNHLQVEHMSLVNHNIHADEVQQLRDEEARAERMLNEATRRKLDDEARAATLLNAAQMAHRDVRKDAVQLSGSLLMAASVMQNL